MQVYVFHDHSAHIRLRGYIDLLAFLYFILYCSQLLIWVFPKIGVPENGWFVVENPIKMDDLGVPLFLEIPILFQHRPTSSSCHRFTPTFAVLHRATLATSNDIHMPVWWPSKSSRKKQGSMVPVCKKELGRRVCRCRRV